MLLLIIFVFARFHKEQGSRRFSSVDICSGLLKSPHKFSSEENLIFLLQNVSSKFRNTEKLIAFVFEGAQRR